MQYKASELFWSKIPPWITAAVAIFGVVAALLTMHVSKAEQINANARSIQSECSERQAADERMMDLLKRYELSANADSERLRRIEISVASVVTKLDSIAKEK